MKNWQATVKADDRIKTIGKMFKLNKGDGSNSELAEELKRRDSIKLDSALPGSGAGGSASDTTDPKDFTKDADHSGMYETK